MKPKPFPHRASVDTLTVDVGFSGEVRVEAELVDVDRELDRAFVVDIDDGEFVHFPYFALHPVPQ